MWSYYGAKTNIVNAYPKPKHDKIIEPFAGSARYSLKYFDREVLLVDQYEVIVKIWQWLQKCSPTDILSLPRKLDIGMSLDDFNFDCEEAKWLMGFLIKKGVERPANKPTNWTANLRPNFTNFSLQRIASNLFKIKHWEIRHGSYVDVQNELATWFLDPPYQEGGHSYVHNNKHINFIQLGEYAQSRIGQIIVCEKTSADWLPFQPLINQKGSKKWQSEAIWTNEKVSYMGKQLEIV
jgi:site-specific DNA-adenine methylase